MITYRCYLKLCEGIRFRMELSGYVLLFTLSVILNVSGQAFHLTVTKQVDTVNVGDKPSYSCFINERADFLINNPLKWEQVGRDGSRKVISTLANVEGGLEEEFDVQLQTTEDGMSFMLTFKQGMKNDYDGFFKCILYSKDNKVLAEKQVEVHIIKMFRAMEFRLDSKVQTVAGEPALSIRLEEGQYDSVCKSMGSNPAASVQIFLDNIEQNGAETAVEDTDRTGPPQAWNVERKVPLTFKPSDDGKVLKCVSKVNNDDSMMGEISYKLNIYTVDPEITCKNASAVENDLYVKLECTIKLPGIDCNAEIFWENGENGEQYRMDITSGHYQTMCEPSPAGSVKTTFVIDAVSSKDFQTDFFIVFENRHGTTKRVVAPLYQDYNAAPSIQYAIFVLCSTLVAAMIL